ncbi:hypothetical protein WDD9_006388 [Paenibacillus melissococcoides]|uniref:phage minor head protein n=1 Tax=Paenibacillus melissococcoides TaxID=2912268 RepID=UPI0021C46572|nr:phage minor head protein [Paenibacillus melissococcoides]CAH8721635.1 hypothetical protein WDD9_006388 [Paenibacillus melissococcoides]
MTAPETLRLRPYWQYDAGPGQAHAAIASAMHGRVFRADDPIWNTWVSPNGFRCRCTVRTTLRASSSGTRPQGGNRTASICPINGQH